MKPTHRSRKANANWYLVDWSEQNGVIAEELGVTPERVRQVRKQRGAPVADNHRRHRGTKAKLELIQAKWAELKGLTRPEAEKLLGFELRKKRPPGLLLLKHNMAVLGQRKATHPWHKMNFDLPSGVLAEIWKVPQQTPYAYRHSKHLPKAKWNLHPARIQALKRSRRYAAYLAAVKVEKQKAKRFHAVAVE